MGLSLRVADRIDRLSEFCAATVCWGLLANALLIAGNAISRKVFAAAWATAFDMQWHFISAVVLLMAAAALRRPLGGQTSAAGGPSAAAAHRRALGGRRCRV